MMMINAKVKEIINISETNFILIMERPADYLPKAGQCLSLGIESVTQFRDYSIHLFTKNEIQLYITEVQDGQLTPKLRKLKQGDTVTITKPFGHFTIDDPKKNNVMIATGSGIAPFNCMLGTIENLKYLIMHGVKDPDEQIIYNANIQMAFSGENRVTDLLKNFLNEVSEYFTTEQINKTIFMLCGNADMISDCMQILKDAGIKDGNIKREVYY